MTADTYWYKQTEAEPLFSDVLWSRPENKRHAGKLLIAGGQAQSFAAPAAAFTAATKAGIGTVKVLLPDSTKKVLGRSFSEAEFAPSTLSGSFSRQALGQCLELAEWSDGVLLAGDFGRNSETAILLEGFMDKYRGLVAVAQDGLDYFWGSDSQLLSRPDTLSAINLGKLQKLASSNRSATPILHKMTLVDIVEALHDWTMGNAGRIITKHAGQLIVASQGQVSTTPYEEELKWQVELPAYAVVWWLQQPQKSFEAITTAIFDYQK